MRTKPITMLSLFTLILPVSVAYAGPTISETTFYEPKKIPGAHQVDFMSFDMNKDGNLSMREVGDVLFKAFDRDQNALIDNIEFNEGSVITVFPTKATTYTYYDYDSDGLPEAKTITESEFMDKSKLIRFDKQYDGLSPHDFIGREMSEVDINRDNFITKDEWRRVYAKAVKPKSSMQDRYN